MARLSPGGANWITVTGFNPRSALPAPGITVSLSRRKINTTGALLKGTGREGGRWGCRSYLCATAASHCSQGGGAQSFTELQRGLESDGRGEETDSPARSACMHSLRRDPGGRARSRDCPDGHTERANPLSMLLSVPAPATVPSGD